jgi:DNA-binding transcriptional ArsR family regulator
METRTRKTNAHCHPQDHKAGSRAVSSPQALDRAGRMFRALGDGPRLRLVELLKQGEICVSELVHLVGEKFSTVSQRLRLLRQEGLVARRRAGTHLYYSLADAHIADLIMNALAHAEELEAGSAAWKQKSETKKSSSKIRNSNLEIRNKSEIRSTKDSENAGS